MNNSANLSKKNGVFLIHPQSDYTETTMIPLGLCYLAAYLEKKGVSTEILDMQIYSSPYKLLFQILSQKTPRIVGITSYSQSLHKTYEVIQQIKQWNPQIITVIGGIHATALPVETMQSCKSIDYLVYGEGEISFFELIYNLINNKDATSVKGTVARVNNQIKFNPPREFIDDLDSLPFPAREKLDLKRYHPGRSQYLRLPTTVMYTTRGCPFECTFCASHQVWGSSVRMMSAERIFQEVLYCLHKLGFRDFCFRDDTFTLSRSRVEQLCNLFIDNKLDVSWSCFSRVDTVDYELLRLMKKAGCFLVQYGIEAGTQKSLDAICKEISLQQAEDAILWSKKAGIETVAGFMFGIPGETVEDMKKTLAFAKKLSPLWAEFRRCDPIPGSKEFGMLMNNSRLLSVPRWRKLKEIHPFDSQIFFKEIKNDSITKLYQRAYLSFYFSPRWLWQKIKRFFKNPYREISTFWHAIPIFLKRMR